MSTTLDISPNRFNKGLLIVLVFILLVAFMTCCKSKKVVTSTSTSEEVKTEEVAEVETTKTAEHEVEKKKVTEEFGGYLIGSVPINLTDLISSKDTATYTVSGDGVDLDISVQDGKLSYKAKATPTSRTTEEVKEKVKEEETRKEETEKKTTSKSETETKSKTKLKTVFRAMPWWLVLVIIGLLTGGYFYIKKKLT